ncbi:phosphoribosylanthranilate isomerase [uncultured Megasphaera sp.]|uniref:phosphoribosylanthranilate isomerase n=1 Tax=uncultured Megasphaera sp. TaxID=165188 RepID=UPI0025D196EF|nr:phosphoribosylanthranilate isomerase [uncultured Megasphaera sp.]
MVKVKFCGLKRPCDIAWANELQPDYAGFVFAGKKRRVSDDQAAALRRELDPSIPAVGVFVDDTPEHIESLVRADTIQLVQLHGGEDEAYIESLRRQVQVPIIKAFSIARKDDVEKARRSPADYVLLDHGKGGTGEVFDWALLAQIDREYFLAGGLNPDNAEKAAALGPYALDVSSGIETDGVKDKEKMKLFMARVRAYRR